MAQSLAALELRLPLFDFAHEPVVVVDQSLTGFAGECVSIDPPLVSHAGECGVHVRRQDHFHVTSVPKPGAESTRPRGARDATSGSEQSVNNPLPNAG